jgi:hypothetical protein
MKPLMREKRRLRGIVLGFTCMLTSRSLDCMHADVKTSNREIQK